MRVVLDSKIPYIKGVLEPYFSVEYIEGEDISPLNIAECDAIVVRTRTACNRQLLEGSRVKFIATATIGFNHIDIDYCNQNGIEVATSSGCNKTAVLQYILTSLAALGVEPNIESNGEPNGELEGKTIGVIGCGNIGSLLVDTLARLGFKVIFNDPLKPYLNGVTLDYLLQNSDIITMHTPLTSTGEFPTENLADSDFFSKIKRGAIFINSSRGEVVDEKALLNAIDSGMVSKAVIDVWRNEPNINPQLLTKATFATTHIAGYSRRGKERATEMVVRALGRKFGVKELENWSINSPKSDNIEFSWDSIKSNVISYFDIERESQVLKNSPENFEKIRKIYPFREEFFEM